MIAGEVVVERDGFPVTVETSVAHGLVDGEEIKITGLGADDALRGSLYPRIIGRHRFALYLDKECSSPVIVAASQAKPVRICRPRSDDYAIVVGINHYPAFSPLKGPETDARAFSRWLLSTDGGCLPRANVNLILPSRLAASVTDATPTLWQVNNAFRAYSTKALATIGYRVGRRLYIFLAGHGITPVRAVSPIMDDTALLMADADDSDLQHLAGLGYAEWFRTAGAFDEIVLFADCCRDQKNNIVPNMPSFPVVVGDRDRVRVFYAAATGLNSKAWERDIGTPPIRRGIFSFVLMEALEQGSACDENGQLTAGKLAVHLLNGVQQLKGEQRPRFMHAAIPDIVLLERSVEGQPNLTISFSASRYGSWVKLIGPKYPKEEDRFQAGPAPIKVHLRLGLYKLLAEDGSSRIFEVKPGGEQHVSI